MMKDKGIANHYFFDATLDPKWANKTDTRLQKKVKEK